MLLYQTFCMLYEGTTVIKMEYEEQQDTQGSSESYRTSIGFGCRGKHLLK